MKTYTKKEVKEIMKKIEIKTVTRLNYPQDEFGNYDKEEVKVNKGIDQMECSTLWDEVSGEKIKDGQLYLIIIRKESPKKYSIECEIA